MRIVLGDSGRCGRPDIEQNDNFEDPLQEESKIFLPPRSAQGNRANRYWLRPFASGLHHPGR